MIEKIVTDKIASILGQAGVIVLFLVVKVLNFAQDLVKAIIVGKVSEKHNGVAYNLV